MICPYSTASHYYYRIFKPCTIELHISDGLLVIVCTVTSVSDGILVPVCTVASVSDGLLVPVCIICTVASV